MSLPVSQFLEAAGMPIRWKESDLQNYIAHKLTEMGFGAKLEVGCNGGRADIVTNWNNSIIEVKKYLDRNTIYQAVGQLNLYGLGNNRNLVVMGFLTPDGREQQSALNTASMVIQDSRIKVIFVNLEDQWLPGQQGFARLNPFKFNIKLPDMKNWRWLSTISRIHPFAWVAIFALSMAAVPEIPKLTHRPATRTFTGVSF